MSAGVSKTVERVVRGQLCTGCGLCAGVSAGAIRMRDVEPGFIRPEQIAPVSGEVEAVIAASCPGARVASWPASSDPYWGPLLGTYVGHATDQRIRFKASSGGALSALLIHALRSGAVDRVVQIMPDPSQPTGNVTVISTTEAEVLARAGSRYAPSSPLESIDAILADGGKAAFVGKPCDVSALRGLGGRDPRVAATIPLSLAFFCAGVPSRRGADRVLAALDVDRRDLTAFRYRGEGWPGRAVATLRSGETRDMSYDDSWGGFLADEVQFRCKICPDGVGGVADIACGDAWYGDERGYPRFDEQDGRSLVIARTPMGQALLADALKAGALVVEPLDPSEIDMMQQGQTQRKRNALYRHAALAVTLQPRPQLKQLKVLEAAKRARISEAARNFLGTIRRIVVRRR